MPAKLDPADLGIRSPDGLGGLLRGDPARLAQTAECRAERAEWGAELDRQDHWPCGGGLSHGAAQDIARWCARRRWFGRSVRSDRHGQRRLVRAGQCATGLSATPVSSSRLWASAATTS